MHVLGTRVPRCLGVARYASSPKTAQALGCRLTPRLWISFGRVTCMARAASVPGLWTLGFLLLRGACVWVRVVVGLGFRLRPATPGWGVGVCVCLCSCSACTRPLLAGVCVVGVCDTARVSAPPRHSWLGCWGVCVLVCVLRLYAATPGWGVQRGCCAWDRVSVAPRHSWLGCQGLCLLVCATRLHPSKPGWAVRCGCVCLDSRFGCAPLSLAGVLWCACLCACSPCTPPLLAWARGVDVCVWVRVSAAPRHCWLACWGVCVVVWALPLY